MEFIKNRRVAFILVLGLVFSGNLISQTRLNRFILNNHLYRPIELPKYNRIGLTIGSTSSGRTINADQINDFFDNKFYDNISSKFDLNTIDVELNNIEINKWHFYKKKKLVGQEIANRLTSSKFGNDVISNVFSPWETPLTYGGPTTIIDRFKKNLTTTDVKKFKFTLDGLNTIMRDSIDLVAKNNYIIVNDYKKIVRMADIYAKRRKFINYFFSILTLGVIDVDDNVDDDRADYRDGWKIKGVSYLYKISIDKPQLDKIWEAYFKKQSSNVVQNVPVKIELVKIKKFKTKRLGFSFVDPTEKLDELRDKCLLDINRETILKFENSVNSFKVKRTVVEGKPIKIEVGTKEGALNNQRYLVMQQMLKNNRLVYKPIGAIRIKKVVNNDQIINKSDDLLNTSKCYQYQGKQLQEGMIVKQANEIGLEVGYEFNYHSDLKLLMPSLKISYDLSNKLKINQLRFFVNFNSSNSVNNIEPLLQSGYLESFRSNSESNIYYIKDENTPNSMTYFSDVKVYYESKSNIPLVSCFGFSWEYNLLNNFFIRPEIGFSSHQISLKTNNENIVIGNSTDYSTFNKIQNNSLSGKILIGGFISPSISFYGGPAFNYSSLNYYGEDKKGVFNTNYNYLSYIFGTKINF